MLPRKVSFRVVLIASILNDVLDLFSFSLPIFDLPVTILHFMFAGPLAIFTLTEYIPIVGYLPIYTVACFIYLGKESISKPRPRNGAHVDTSFPETQRAQRPVTIAPLPPAPPPQRILNSPTVIDIIPLPTRTQTNGEKPPVEERLAKIALLLSQNHITQAEHDAKRLQILAEL